ncbi:hypothetical protein [Mycobacterium antarcticum]|uniref:hypothetical protein n=1 Tax=Mycolicibacterium sp. TUM20984 TaxID=3023368 RepID=UPI0024E10E4C|nr:hypothetical protein [Mycolicibacterium sp. TUM20984]
MRIAVLVTACALVAGCSTDTDGAADRTSPSPSSTPTSSTTSIKPSIKPSLAPTVAPAEGTDVADVIRWIEAGEPADASGYRSMTRNGETTELGDGVAFVTAGTESNCVTNRYLDGALACLVKLADPPPRPPGIETAWKANWVDFAAAGVDVGSPHGDPGPFVDGTGAELPAGHSLAFGEYRCRADAVGLFCVDYAHQAAVKLSATGVEGFGCLKKVTPPADIGLRLSC